jgi:hypothetical protein
LKYKITAIGGSEFDKGVIPIHVCGMSLDPKFQKNFTLKKTKKGSQKTSVITFDVNMFKISDPKCSTTHFTMNETTIESPGLQ